MRKTPSNWQNFVLRLTFRSITIWLAPSLEDLQEFSSWETTQWRVLRNLLMGLMINTMVFNSKLKKDMQGTLIQVKKGVDKEFMPFRHTWEMKNTTYSQKEMFAKEILKTQLSIFMLRVVIWMLNLRIPPLVKKAPRYAPELSFQRVTFPKITTPIFSSLDIQGKESLMNMWSTEFDSMIVTMCMTRKKMTSQRTSSHFRANTRMSSGKELSNRMKVHHWVL